MKNMIEIPEALYQSVIDETYCGSLYDELKNGTPLPKGHGRLIDVDALENKIECHFILDMISRYEHDLLLHYTDVEMSPTIIEDAMNKAIKELESDGANPYPENGQLTS